jgi:hypothetical protein
MADTVKISELVELVSGSVLGTTIVPVVSGGTTQKVQMSSVKAYVNSDVVTDSELSTQISAVNSTIGGLDTDDISEAGNLYYTDARVKTKLNTEGVLSGSFLEVGDGDGTPILNVDTITFSGATVTGDSGTAIVTISATSLNVNDGATSVNSVDSITFSGASVADNGSGDVTVSVSGLTVIDTVVPTSVNGVDQITFDGATVTNNGSGDITVTIAESSGDSVATMIHTASINQFTSSTDAHIFNIASYTSSVNETLTSIDAHILDIATFTSSFSSSVDGRLVTLEEAGGGGSVADGTISSSQQITDFGFFSSSLDIENRLVFIPGASLSLTSESNGQTVEYSIDVAGGPSGGTGDVSYTNGFHIISQSTSTLESNAILSEMYVDGNQNITFTQFSSSVDSRFGSGGGSDYISNVSFANNTLTFTGTGFGFNGTVPLATGLVSGSGQIIELGFLTDYQITTEFLAGAIPNIISGSSQLSDLGFLSNESGVFSGSSQVSLILANSSSFTTANVSEDSSNLYYTDARVKTKLDIEGVFSSSEQITVAANLVSASAQINYAEVYNQLELRSGSNAILITSGTAGYGNPYITIGLDGTAYASIQTENDLETLSNVFHTATIPSSSTQLSALGAVALVDLNQSLTGLNGFTGSLGTFGVTSASLASRIDTIASVGFEIESGFQLISQSNSISNLILDLVRIDSSGTTFNNFSASVAAGVGVGASTFAGLTDTEFSSYVGGDLVKYNATTEKWENTLQLNGAYIITGSLFVTGGAVTADSFVAGDVGTPIIDSATSLDISAATEVYISSTGDGVVIEDILVLNKVIGDTPTAPLTGSLMNSGSVDDDTKLWFFNGTEWKEVAFV